MSGDGAALGARLRERDLSAAPAALNLLESATAADREQSAALLREVSPQALGGEAPGHVIGITGPPGAGKSTLLSALLHAWRAASGRTVAMLAVDPSSRRSGGALLGDRARIEFDAADRGVLIRSTAAGERLGGLAWPTRAAAHALAAAFDVVVIETVGVGPGRDGDRRRRRHRRRRRAARQRRRAAVPEVRDHGDPRRARRHQGRPRPARHAHPARSERGAALARLALHARARGLLACPRPEASRSWSRRSRSTARVSTSPGGGCDARRASALADYAREHGERGLRALGGRHAAEALLAEQEPGLDVPALVSALERSGRG